MNFYNFLAKVTLSNDKKFNTKQKTKYYAHKEPRPRDHGTNNTNKSRFQGLKALDTGNRGGHHMRCVFFMF